MAKPAVTVVTVTSGRSTLRRASASVWRQASDAYSLRHLILVDGLAAAPDAVDPAEYPAATVVHYPARGCPEGQLERLAVLRNTAMRFCDTDYVAFLDDDNEYLGGHIASLVRLAEEGGFEAVHSWAEWVHKDGSPYLEPSVPFHRSREQCEKSYWDRVGWGTLTPGSNISRDRADPLEVPDGARTVDMGEWMFKHSLVVDRTPFPETYDESDWSELVTEDDKLLLRLISANVRIGCTRKATHRYYMGGFTNAAWTGE